MKMVIMMKKFSILILFLLLNCVFADENNSKTQKSEENLTKSDEKTKITPMKGTLFDFLKKKYASAATLKAEFTQIQKNKMMGSEKKSEGILEIKRPDKFRWDTLTPDPTLLLSNGKKIIYYTPPFHEGEKGQVIYKKSADVQSKLAVDLLSGSSNLKKDFKPKKVADRHYELIPIKKNLGDINKIELYIDPKADLVYKLKLQHTTENETEIELKNVQLGEKLENSRFEFNAPPNTEVIQ